MEEFEGVIASTRKDLHNEILTIDELKQLSEETYNNTTLVYYDHHETLPPLGILTKSWIEVNEEGIHELKCSGYLFNKENKSLSDTGLQAPLITELSKEDRGRIFKSAFPSNMPHFLGLAYDPQNFDTQDVNNAADKITEVVDIDVRIKRRKADIPPDILWLGLVFAAGSIAGGFFKKMGEDAYSGVKSSYTRLITSLMQLMQKTKSRKIPDIIFVIPIPNCSTVVSAAIENPDLSQLPSIIQNSPDIYIQAVKFLELNGWDRFSHIKYIFNRSTRNWEINYVITKIDNQVIHGPRYNDVNHPERQRYEEILKRLAEDEGKPLGMSFGAVLENIDSKSNEDK